jgi:UDP-glucose 4-epimerase
LICNLGTGRGISVLELVAELRKTGKVFSVEIEAAREGDPASLVASNSLSTKILQINYDHSNIETILKSAIKWHERTKL